VLFRPSATSPRPQVVERKLSAIRIGALSSLKHSPVLACLCVTHHTIVFHIMLFTQHLANSVFGFMQNIRSLVIKDINPGSREPGEMIAVMQLGTLLALPNIHSALFSTHDLQYIE
jgi:hypothetical protein